MRVSISKINDFPIFVEDSEDQWAIMRFTLADQFVYSEGYSYDNVHVDTVAGAPKTTGTIGPITVTSDKTHCFFKIYLLGRGDTSDCSLALNRSVVSGTDEIGEWFTIDEDSFTYTITLSGTVSIEKVIIVGFRYGDGTMQHVTLS